MMDTVQLAGLVLEIQDGNTAAFDRLYQETYSSVYFRAISLTGREEDACDVVQETYLAAFQSLESLKNPEAVLAWLHGIARNQALNLKRYQQRRMGPSLDDEKYTYEPISEEETPEEVLDREDTQEIIGKMIEKLSPVQRQVVTLFYYDALSVEQIAELLGCSKGTVQSRLNYARQHLKTQIIEEERKHGVKLYELSPAAILAGLRWLERHTVMPQQTAAQIGTELAKSCGYSSLLSVGGASAAATGGAASAVGGLSVGGKVVAIVLAAAVAVGGVTAGIAASRNRTVESEPTAVIEAVETPEPTPMSAPQAAAYYNVLRKIVEEKEIRTPEMESKGIGLSYARLIDFDNDGVDELYLYYLDEEQTVETNGFQTNYRTERRIHEQIWAWDGNTAGLVYEQEHSDRSVSSRYDYKRFLYIADGITYLAEHYYAQRDGNLWMDQDLKRLEDGTFRTALHNSVTSVWFDYVSQFGNSWDEAMARYGVNAGERTASGDQATAWHFVSGTITRDDVEKNYSYDDVLASYTEADGWKYLSASDGDDPVSLWIDMENQLNDHSWQVFGCNEQLEDINTPMRWEVNDVQALIDELQRLGAGAEAAEAVAERAPAGSEGRAFAAFVAQTNYPDSYGENRFLLHDVDGDGQMELLAVHLTNTSRNTTEPICEVYRLSDSSEVERCYAGEPYPLGTAFYEIEMNGRSYLAARDYSYQLYDGEIITFHIIDPKTYETVATLYRYLITERRTESGEVVSTHEVNCTLNGNPISETEYSAIANTAKQLVMGPIASRDAVADGSLSRAEFLAKYE